VGLQPGHRLAVTPAAALVHERSRPLVAYPLFALQLFFPSFHNETSVCLQGCGRIYLTGYCILCHFIAAIFEAIRIISSSQDLKRIIITSAQHLDRVQQRAPTPPRNLSPPSIDLSQDLHH
jgi:hypothetical protein